MNKPAFLRCSRLLIIVAIGLSALVSRAEAPGADAGGALPPAVIVAQADAPPAPESAAPAPQPEELPRMTNRALAFWGVAFMLTVCVAFSALGGYAIYTGHGGKKGLPQGGAHDSDTPPSP